MDIFGPLQLGRAVSTLEAQLPSAHSLTAPGGGGGGGADLEPYMPQWQSESVPAELPNHVVDRLLMSGNPHALQKPSRCTHMLPAVLFCQHEVLLGLVEGWGKDRVESDLDP